MIRESRVSLSCFCHLDMVCHSSVVLAKPTQWRGMINAGCFTVEKWVLTEFEVGDTCFMVAFTYPYFFSPHYWRPTWSFSLISTKHYNKFRSSSYSNFWALEILLLCSALMPCEEPALAKQYYIFTLNHKSKSHCLQALKLAHAYWPAAALLASTAHHASTWKAAKISFFFSIYL